MIDTDDAPSAPELDVTLVRDDETMAQAYQMEVSINKLDCTLFVY